ncbi:MAG: DUF4392 domain-containing protein [Synergistaceae bacterium]|nr:DUF4392 domain-containing protein [Synergistaceae bacterium]
MTLKIALSEQFAKKLIAIVSRDRGGRGVSKLCRPSDWRAAAESFAPLRRVAVISGFFIPGADAPETDGPGGAVMLARAYLRQGRSSEIWTDALCIDVMKACAEAAGYPAELVKEAPSLLADSRMDGLIFSERLGRAADGGYYNFRKMDISRWTPALDRLADEARLLSIPTFGIGDGGNEVGMGCFYDELCALLPDYASCLCTVRTDCAVAVDVSNWGAYAATAALSCLWGSWRGPERGEELAMLEAVIKAGAVDGISRRPELTVDGFDIAVQDKVISSLFELWSQYSRKR